VATGVVVVERRGEPQHFLGAEVLAQERLGLADVEAGVPDQHDLVGQDGPSPSRAAPPSSTRGRGEGRAPTGRGCAAPCCVRAVLVQAAVRVKRQSTP
jgi:hypothetical protein